MLEEYFPGAGSNETSTITTEKYRICIEAAYHWPMTAIRGEGIAPTLPMLKTKSKVFPVVFGGTLGSGRSKHTELAPPRQKNITNPEA
jgi:hypothetical protein